LAELTKLKGAIKPFEGKKQTFDDSD